MPGRAARADLEGAEEPDAESADSPDPDERVVSAEATAGIAATAAPIPKATANAPTRPPYRP